MSGLVEFTHYQAEALLICLAGSVIWAGMLFFGARGLERAAATASAERLWTAALLFAVLPSLVAPTLAAFGVSGGGRLRWFSTHPSIEERIEALRRLA